MNPAVVNVVVGLVQVIAPALIAYLIGTGWITQNEMATIGAILAGLGFTGWSAATTSVASPAAVSEGTK